MFALDKPRVAPPGWWTQPPPFPAGHSLAPKPRSKGTASSKKSATTKRCVLCRLPGTCVAPAAAAGLGLQQTSQRPKIGWLTSKEAHAQHNRAACCLAACCGHKSAAEACRVLGLLQSASSVQLEPGSQSGTDQGWLTPQVRSTCPAVALAKTQLAPCRFLAWTHSRAGCAGMRWRHPPLLQPLHSGLQHRRRQCKCGCQHLWT